jgi:hypothetical protein
MDAHQFERGAAFYWVPGLRLLTPMHRTEPGELGQEGGEIGKQQGRGSGGAAGHDFIVACEGNKSHDTVVS